MHLPPSHSLADISNCKSINIVSHKCHFIRPVETALQGETNSAHLPSCAVILRGSFIHVHKRTHTHTHTHTQLTPQPGSSPLEPRNYWEWSRCHHWWASERPTSPLRWKRGSGGGGRGNSGHINTLYFILCVRQSLCHWTHKRAALVWHGCRKAVWG